MNPRPSLLALLLLPALFTSALFTSGQVLGAPPTGRLAGTVRIAPAGSAVHVSTVAEPVVVFVEDAPGPFTPPAPLVIRQRGRQFHPRLLIVPLGSSVEFPNDDTVDHNVFSPSPDAHFDLGYYGAGNSRRQVFDKVGAVRIYCNIHPQMIADVLVLPGPSYARVGADGRFAIEGVPAGKRSLRAWFGLGPSVQHSVTVEAGRTAAIAIDLESTVATPVHDNKHGEPYFLDYPR